MRWKIGAGSIRIPLPVGVALEGYAARVARSTHVHGVLLATAMAMSTEDEPLVVAAVDALAVDRDLCAEVAARAGLDPRRFVLCASHTHSGPAGLTSACAPSGVVVARRIRDTVVECCAQAVRDALATLAPAELRFSRAWSTGVTANRVTIRGPRDRRISVLAARRPDGSPIAALVLLACHPTVLGADSTAISADLSGAVRATLVEFAGPIVVFTGAAADLSTRFTRRAQNVEELTRLGRRLGTSAWRALSRAGATLLEPTLEIAAINLTLPGKHLRSESELRELVWTLAKEVDQAVAAGRSAQRVRGAVTRAEGAVRELELVREAAAPGAFDLIALRMGSLGLLFAPAEISTTLGRRIEETSPFSETLVVGYAGGYVGYVVDRTYYARQAYEALASPFAPESGDALVCAAATLLASISD